MNSGNQATTAAEVDWLERWTAGPSHPEGSGLPAGAVAPDLTLLDDTGAPRPLSEFWSTGPALVMFWRHFGCSCGIQRAQRLRSEWSAYAESGLTPVIIGQGDPVRAGSYREQYDVPAPILVDPDGAAYEAFGVGHWPVERVLYDAPADMWSHGHEVGARFQAGRREAGRAPVDDPWRATAEFVIDTRGKVRLGYLYQYCEDFPDPRVLTAAARLGEQPWLRGASARR